MRDESFCFLHHPKYVDAAAEARRVRHSRETREFTLATHLGIDGVSTVADLQHILTVVLLETFSLPNAVPRNRTLVTAVQAAAKLLEVGDQEQRLEALEETVSRLGAIEGSLMDVELSDEQYEFVDGVEPV
jgi:hypothetical protein